MSEAAPSITEIIARALVPAMLDAASDYSDVPPEHVWIRPRYLWLREMAERHAAEIAPALEAAGLAIVPKEPTEAMTKAGVETECGLGPYTLPDVVAASYRAMINTGREGA